MKFDGAWTFERRSLGKVGDMNLVCTHCPNRWYSAAAAHLIGSACADTQCPGRLVPADGRPAGDERGAKSRHARFRENVASL